MSRAIKAALLIESARRTGERDRVREVVLRLVVYRTGGEITARAMARLLRVFFGRAPLQRYVAPALTELGGYASRRGNERLWLDVAVRPNVDAAKRRILAGWERRLSDEDLSAEPEMLPEAWKWGQGRALGHARLEGGAPPHNLAERIEQVRTRRLVNTGVFERACEYLWGHDWKEHAPIERAMWEAFALEGMTVREIARKLGETRGYVGGVLTRHKARCGLQ